MYKENVTNWMYTVLFNVWLYSTFRFEKNFNSFERYNILKLHQLHIVLSQKTLQIGADELNILHTNYHIIQLKIKNIQNKCCFHFCSKYRNDVYHKRAPTYFANYFTQKNINTRTITEVKKRVFLHKLKSNHVVIWIQLWYHWPHRSAVIHSLWHFCWNTGNGIVSW